MMASAADIDVAAATAHLCRRIRETPVAREPWPHQLVDEFLPPDVFEALLASIPEAWLRMRVEEPRSWVLPYGEGKLEHSEGTDLVPWQGREREASTLWHIIRALNDERQIFEALKVPFRREMKAAVERFTARFVETPRPVQVSRLTRDARAYDLLPHTDVPNKLASIVLYVRSDAGTKLGTTLHAPIEPGFACGGFTYHDPAGFREAGMVPFRPNSAFIFVRDDHTFHGVCFEPGAPDFARVTIQSNFWIVDPRKPLHTRPGRGADGTPLRPASQA